MPTPHNTWRTARCDRIRAGASLVMALIAERQNTAHYHRQTRCLTLLSDEWEKIKQLEELRGLLLELASEELLG